MELNRRMILAVGSAFFAVLGGAFIVAGVQGVMDWKKERAPLRISLSDYLRTRPPNHWLELTDCVIHPGGAVYHRRKSGAEIIDEDVPVYPSDHTTGSVHVLLTISYDHDLSPEEMAAIRSRLNGDHTTIKCMLNTGLLYTGLSDDLKAVAKFRLADDYIMLTWNKTPHPAIALGALIAGFVIFACVGRSVIILMED